MQPPPSALIPRDVNEVVLIKNRHAIVILGHAGLSGVARTNAVNGTILLF